VEWFVQVSTLDACFSESSFSCIFLYIHRYPQPIRFHLLPKVGEDGYGIVTRSEKIAVA
jgi:hypothetical protein